MQDTVKALIEAAHHYRAADARLEQVCGETMDPIACTVFAYRGKHLETLPAEAMDAGFYLGEVTRLVGVLIQQYGVDPDVARSYYLPILNAP